MTVPDSEKTPEQLRAEIRETREQLGETVEQLAAKADVKARVKQDVHERTGAARETVQQAPRPALVGAGLAALGLALVVVRGRRRR